MTQSKPSSMGVVITTYNQPAWLSLVLSGYEVQTDSNFTVLIANDGSTDDTRAVVTEFQNRGKLQIEHFWQPDDGFQKCKILNQVIAQTHCDYLIFTDGDCIPRPDFVAVHRAFAKPECFLSGGYIKLTQAVSAQLTAEQVQLGVVFERSFLRSLGQPRSHKLMKLTRSPWVRAVMNRFTPTVASWNGMNSSTWREHLLAVNGFNEDMQYGGLDRELGERLWNLGIKSQQIRFSAICLHLEHPRGYAKPEIWAKNQQIRKAVKETKATVALNGIRKLASVDEI